VACFTPELETLLGREIPLAISTKSYFLRLCTVGGKFSFVLQNCTPNCTGSLKYPFALLTVGSRRGCETHSFAKSKKQLTSVQDPSTHSDRTDLGGARIDRDHR
jgi:hypothetical protein